MYKYGKRTRQLKYKIMRQLKFKIMRPLKIKRELKNGNLSHYGIWANILGALLIKQLFHSRLLYMRWL